MTRRLKLNVPVQPGKGYSLTMARPPMCPEIPCYFYEKSVVATPWKSGFRLGGTMEFSGFNSDIVARRIQNLTSAAGEYLKEPMGKTIIEQWVGMRPMVYDDLPIIDRAPNQHNLVLATGHGMSGISMATSTGKLVAEIITGSRPHIDPAALGSVDFTSHLSPPSADEHSIIRLWRIKSLLKMLIRQNVWRTALLRFSRRSPALVSGRRRIGLRLLSTYDF